MKKIAISILALAAVSTAALAGNYDGRERSGNIILKPGVPKYIVNSPLAIGNERAGKSNYQILREKAAADISGGPGVNN